jgi:hypothetical protein
MPTKRKATKKKAAKRSGGIASFTRKVNNAPAVKRAAKKVTELEKKLAAAKRIKAAARKKAIKTVSKKKK